MEKAVEIDTAHHAVDVLAKFNRFRKDNKYCDFIIKSGKEEMPVHKCVVAANSEFFDAMFSHDNIENKEGVVEIKQTRPRSVKKCIEFMYTGKATVADEHQEELLHTAHMLRLHRLYNGIAIFLEQHLDCHSFFRTRRIANRYDCDKLTEVCNEFALDNFEAIAENDEFKTLEAEYMACLLSSDNLKDNDAAKCRALMIWINNESNQAASLFNLMKGINFNNIPISYRMFLLNDEEKVFTNVECAKHVLQSVMNTQEIEPRNYSLTGTLGMVLLDTASKKLQRFTVEDETWTEMQALGPGMSSYHSSAVVVDDYIYVVVWDRSMHRIKYRVEDANWEQMASPNMKQGVTTVLEGLIYMTDHGSYQNSIERYNPTINKWSLLPAKKLSTHGSSLAASCGTLYVIGGYANNPKGAVNNVETFKVSTSEWTDVATMNVTRYHASAVGMDSNLYVFGGYNGHGDLESSMEIYNPISNAWQLVIMASFSRFCFSSWKYCRKIYLICGNKSGNQTIDEFDPETKILTRITELNGKSINYYSSVAVLM